MEIDRLTPSPRTLVPIIPGTPSGTIDHMTTTQSSRSYDGVLSWQLGAAVVVSEPLAVTPEHYLDLVTDGEHRDGSVGAVLVDVSRGASLPVVGWREYSEFTNLLIAAVSEYCEPASYPNVIATE
jgi:hypothetical protein